MDNSDIWKLIILIVLLILSAFFSSAETALTTVNKIKLRTLADNKNKKASLVLKITDDSSKMLSAILIGNNIVNLSASSLSTSLAIKYFGSYAAGIVTGILTLVILIFGEITPKTLATIQAEKYSFRYARIISVLMLIFTPFIFILNNLSKIVLFLFRIDPDKINQTISEEEIRTIVDVGQESGVIEHEERDIIHNLFDFGDANAKEVMVPRIDMVFISINSTYDDIIEVFKDNKFTRLPVYEDTTDNVVGTINIKDLLLCKNQTNFTINSILRKPYFTFESKNTADLFIEMRKNSISMAIVLDEYGSTAGLITLEDLLEEIVGEIRDEYDFDEEDDITQISEREFLVLGSANIDDVSNTLKIHLESDDYDTIGGYCLGLLDHLPVKNEIVINDDNVLLKINQVDKNRIERVYIKLPSEEIHS